jgi:hypothetical protein
MVARAGVVVMAAAGPGKAACRHAAAAAGRVRGRTYLHATCMVEDQKSYEGQTDDPEAAGRARDGRSRPAGQWSGLGEPRSTRRAAICAHTLRYRVIHSPPLRRPCSCFRSLGGMRGAPGTGHRRIPIGDAIAELSLLVAAFRRGEKCAVWLAGAAGSVSAGWCRGRWVCGRARRVRRCARRA